MIFYNVENLFDDINDIHTGDDEFLVDAIRRWSTKRFNHKLQNISKAILASNKWSCPEIIGLCEIENMNVINELCQNSLLSKSKLKIIHKESSDRRGIDVCLLYNYEKIRVLDTSFISVKIDSYNSRDMLYAQFEVNKDTIHVFVCHWPSRYGGALSSERKRLIASSLLKNKLKNIFSLYKNPKLIIMGDFNDEVKNLSLQCLVNSKYSGLSFNLISLIKKKNNLGTLKYRSQWYVFDQFFVTDNLCIKKAKICNPVFLFIQDKKYLGQKPFRSFESYKYIGGYSDHLPILLKLNISK